MENYSIYIVEADPWYGEVLAYHLGLNPDYKVTRFITARECLENMHLKPNLVTIDLSLLDMKGEDFYRKVKEFNPEAQVIVISSKEDKNVAENLLKIGVNDYLIKDEATKDLLWNTIIRIRQSQSLGDNEKYLGENLNTKVCFEKTFVGDSESLKKVFKMMDKAIGTNINVFITGETGTGKEVVAKAIHYNSNRKKYNFIAVNMTAIPRELMESELFGHEKGAFTGATCRKIGKFEEANGGTIFLDEIADMDMSLQSKLLRVLQEREVVRVGGNQNIAVDVRLLIATHKNLADQVRKGNFREDLYYRLMGLPIELPPLRDRGNDVLILAIYFIEQFSKENKLGSIILTQAAKNKLMQYNYPGNIRELKSVIELAAIMCEGGEIKVEDICFSSSTTTTVKENFIVEEKSLRDYTNDIIRYFLKKYNNDVIATANKLDIGKSTIYKMIQQK
jgi:two-component system, NtrC family, response regulator AtoC